MGAKGRTREQILKDRMEIAHLYLQGWSQWKIGEKFGFTHQQISHDLKAIRAEWKASAVRDFDEAKAQELAKLDNVEREYWEAWERSCTQSKRTKQVSEMADQEMTDEEGKALDPQLAKVLKPKVMTPKRAEVETIERVGDPRYLEGIERCIEKRCQILGLYTPKRMNVTLDQEIERLLEEYVKLGGDDDDEPTMH